MSRQHGTFEFSNNLEPKIMAPLDARTLVYNISSLFQETTWLDSSGNMWIYNGLPVTVLDTSTTLSGIYILLDKTNYTDIKSWLKVGAIEPLIFKNTDGQGPLHRDTSNNIITFRSLMDSSTIKVTFNDNNIFIDASLPKYALDASLLYEVKLLQDYNKLQDTSISIVNTSINDLYSIKLNNASIGLGFEFNSSTNKYDIHSYENSIGSINSSINIINSSINIINASLNNNNASINDLYSIKLNNASIGQGFIFNQLTKKFDIFSYDASISLINASINRIDSSILSLFNTKLNDASIGKGFEFNKTTGKYDVISTDPSFATVNASINEIKNILGMKYPDGNKTFIDASTTALTNINTLDYMLSLMAPAKPDKLSELDLKNSNFIGPDREIFISAGLPANWYGELTPGSVLNRYTTRNKYIISCDNMSNSFYGGLYCDNSSTARGSITLEVNDKSYTMDLYKPNTEIPINNIDISAYLRFNSETGYGGTNNNFWRVINCDVSVNYQRDGQVRYRMKHSLSGYALSDEYNIYDSSTASISLSKVSTDINGIIYKYLSGIKHAGLNSIIKMGFSINSGVFYPVYRKEHFMIFGGNALTQFYDLPDDFIPHYNDSHDTPKIPLLIKSPNICTRSEELCIIYTIFKFNDEYSNLTRFNYRVNTYPDRSNTTDKYFTDEATRLLDVSSNTDTPWDSTNINIFKANGPHAQVQNGILTYPIWQDYSVVFSGPKYYKTRFTKIAASSGRLDFTGFNPQQHVNPYPKSNVNIILWLSDQNIYFDISKPYNPLDPNDGKTIEKAKGAKVGDFGDSYIKFSFGTYSTGLETTHKDTFCMLFIFNNLFASNLSQISLS